MSAVVSDTSRPSAVVLQRALQRVLSSNAFARSERLRAFLSYVVETELEGNGAQLKGYTIAVDVFGRPHAFDADGDPLVRVHAGKLRKLLDSYYATEGAGEEWRIVIPKGSYVPEYQRQACEQPVPAAPPSESVTPEKTAPLRRAAPRARRPWLPAPISSHFALLSVLPLLIVAPLATPAMSINSGLSAREAQSSLRLHRMQELPQVTISGQWPRESLPARFADTMRNVAVHFRTVTTIGTRLRPSPLAFTIAAAYDEESNGIKVRVVNDLTADSVFTTVIESERLEDESDMLFESASLANRVLTISGEIYRYARTKGIESALMNCMALTETYRREQTKNSFHEARKCQDGLSSDRRDSLQFIVSAGALPTILDR